MDKSIYLKGPSCYQETDKELFWGREKETQDVFNLVSNSDYCVCCAKSGEGKSSLLNAGLMPKLRKCGFLPVNIRFSRRCYENENPDFDAIVLSVLEKARKDIGADYYKSVDVDEKIGKIHYHGEKNLNESLWWNLRVNEIRKDAFTQLTPVLIFDQFEEIFANSVDIGWVNKFFVWLEELYNDMNPCDNMEVGRLGKKFKVLLSLRSEYICELDYWAMQRCFIPSLKNNRYYLKPLTGNAADEIVTRIFEKIDFNGIAKDTILEFSQSDKTNEFYEDEPCKSALKLSLILDTCYRYKECVVALIGKDGDNIDAASLSDILEIYYDEATSMLPRQQRDKIEDLLVDSRGRRNKVLENELCSIIREEQLEKLKEKRIVTTIGSNEIEIAHDCLREIVFKHSSERRKKIEQERNQAVKNKWYVILLVIFSGCALVSFFLFRRYGYQEVHDFYVATRNIGKAWWYGLFNGGAILCFFPYLLPLLGFIVCCLYKKKVYIEVPEIISVTSGSLLVLLSCFFYDSIFNTTIGEPNIIDSCWGVFGIPCLLFACCISYIWKRMKINGWLLIAYPISIVPLIFCEFINEYVNRYTCFLFISVSIGILAIAFKRCPNKKKSFYVTINALVLMACFLGHLGFCPFKINYSEVDMSHSIPWNLTIIQKNQQYGVVDAVKGDTIIPCLFDGIKDGGFVMLLSPTGEELKDPLLSVNNINSVVDELHQEGCDTKLNSKNGIRYVYVSIDKALYDVIQNDSTEYDVEASKAYFTVRDGLYKAIKRNLPINKINVSNLAKLYEMERKYVDILHRKLKQEKPSFNTTELLITHSARQMSVAVILDMINDNRSNLSLLKALDAFRTAYFSQKMYEQHINFKANIQFNYNTDISFNVKDSSNSIVSNKNHKNSLFFNAMFSNNDSSPLSSISLWQYVYAQTLGLIAPPFASRLPEKLQNIAKMKENQFQIFDKMLKNVNFDSDDVDYVIKDIKANKDLIESIKNVVSKKNASQLSYVDSLITINDKYEQFDPFQMFKSTDMRKIRQTATKNISRFYDLYKYYSDTSPNDYQYAIFRKNMVDNLYLASFCGGGIIPQIRNLKEQDSSFFNYTYKALGATYNSVDSIRANAETIKTNCLNKIRGILQNRVKKHK